MALASWSTELTFIEFTVESEPVVASGTARLSVGNEGLRLYARDFDLTILFEDAEMSAEFVTDRVGLVAVKVRSGGSRCLLVGRFPLPTGI